MIGLGPGGAGSGSGAGCGSGSGCGSGPGSGMGPGVGSGMGGLGPLRILLLSSRMTNHPHGRIVPQLPIAAALAVHIGEEGGATTGSFRVSAHGARAACIPVGGILEASPGIEPGCKDLQSSA